MTDEGFKTILVLTNEIMHLLRDIAYSNGDKSNPEHLELMNKSDNLLDEFNATCLKYGAPIRLKDHPLAAEIFAKMESGELVCS